MKKTLFAALIAAALVTGCTAFGQQAETGQFEVLVSDQPAAIADFSSLNVSISEVRVFPADAANETNASYVSIDARDRTVDLTRVVGTSAESLVNATLETGNYSKIELHVESVDAVVNGSSVTVQVPSEKLMLTRPFTIAPNATTRFVFDIHVVRTGTGRYVLRPVIAQSGVVGEDVAEPEPPTAPGNRSRAPTGAGR